MEEGKSAASNGPQLAHIFAINGEIPFNTLEGSFMNFSAPEALLAYAESLTGAEYIRDAYGMSEIARILGLLSQGITPEAALRNTIHADYRQLRDDISHQLKSKYGE